MHLPGRSFPAGGPLGRLILCVLLMAGLLGAIAHAPAQAATGARQTRGTLAVVVSGLPPFLHADVQVTGPGYKAHLAGGRFLRNLKPGRYRVAARRLSVTKATHKLAAGTRALPDQPVITVVVTAGHTAHAAVNYGTVINGRVDAFRSRVLGLAGPAENPTSLTVAASARPAVGRILTARPMSSLPYGLFHVVTRVDVRGTRAVVHLRPARLAEVFPELHLHGSLPVVADEGDHLDGPTLGVKQDDLSCSTPLLATASFSSSLSLDASADIDFDIPTYWDIPDGLPNGKAILTLHAQAALSASLPKNTSCTASLKSFPTYSGIIPVGEVPVPYYISGSYGASLGVSGSDLTANAQANASLTGGITFKGTNVSPVGSLDGSASASASGGLKVSTGPTVRIAIGVKDVGDVRFDVKPGVSLSADLDGSCALGVFTKFSVGAAFGPVSVNQSLPGLSDNLYTCPTAPAPVPVPSPVGPILPLPSPAPTPPAPLGAPVGISGSGGVHSAQITWSPPESDGGSPITGYTVVASPGGATATVDGSTTTANFTGLNPGSYTFTVTAANAQGPGPASDPSFPITVVDKAGIGFSNLTLVSRELGGGAADPSQATQTGSLAASSNGGYLFLGADTSSNLLPAARRTSAAAAHPVILRLQKGSGEPAVIATGSETAPDTSGFAASADGSKLFFAADGTNGSGTVIEESDLTVGTTKIITTFASSGTVLTPHVDLAEGLSPDAAGDDLLVTVTEGSVCSSGSFPDDHHTTILVNPMTGAVHNISDTGGAADGSATGRLVPDGSVALLTFFADPPPVNDCFQGFYGPEGVVVYSVASQDYTASYNFGDEGEHFPVDTTYKSNGNATSGGATNYSLLMLPQGATSATIDTDENGAPAGNVARQFQTAGLARQPSYDAAYDALAWTDNTSVSVGEISSGEQTPVALPTGVTQATSGLLPGDGSTVFFRIAAAQATAGTPAGVYSETVTQN